MAAQGFTAIGLDVGAQKTMIVAEDGEIIRTSTGIPTFIYGHYHIYLHFDN